MRRTVNNPNLLRKQNVPKIATCAIPNLAVRYTDLRVSAIVP
jgi:hypothetical protein